MENKGDSIELGLIGIIILSILSMVFSILEKIDLSTIYLFNLAIIGTAIRCYIKRKKEK